MRKALLVSTKLSLCAVGYICAFTQTASGQVTTDGTLNTEVNQNGNVTEITGGATRGNNLFHSFQDFSLPNGNEAFFNNADNVSNIFSRVTGGNVSNINGSLRTNNASLFLINPAGVIFGNGARLNLGGGSFYGSTADSILFEDGEFSAVDLDNPLLTINAPIGLGFRDNPAPIEVNGSSLVVAPGEDLTLLGGRIDFNNGANIFAPGANVQLGAISGSGTVDLDANFQPSFPEDLALADIFLNGGIRINVEGEDGGAIAFNGNNIQLADDSRLIAGIGNNAGTPESQAGDIVLNARENISLNGASFISNRVGDNGLGNGGDVRLFAGSDITFDGVSFVRNEVRSGGQGNGGDVRLFAGSNITLDGNSAVRNQVNEGGQGNGGNISVEAPSLTLNNTSPIIAVTFGAGNSGNVSLDIEDTVAINSDSSLRSLVLGNGSGNAGEINVNTNVLILETIGGTPEDRSLIFSNTFGSGNAGNINLNATERISINNSSILAQVDTDATGNGGEVTINTPRLEIFNTAAEVPAAPGIFTTTDGTGNAGNINITTSEALTIERRSSIGAGTTSDGDAGNITIDTDFLSVSDFALIASNILVEIENPGGETGTINGAAGAIDINANNIVVSEGGSIDASIINVSRPNEFFGGDININTNTLELFSGGKISTVSTNSNGNAGNLNLTIAERLTIEGSNPALLPPEFRDFREPLLELETITGLLANTRLGATGNGGNINITAPNAAIEIANGEAQISVESQGTGSGGSIAIEAAELSLDNNGAIFASTPAGEGGSISLTVADTIIFRNESNVTARAFGDANGGNININTDLIIGFPSEPDGNSITASAENGDGGNISITAEDILGWQERRATPGNGTNDIDASSEFGFDGSVSIQTPDVSSLQGITELSVNTIEPNDNVTQVCSIDANSSRNSKESSFVVLGKGGIPSEPTEALSADRILIENQTVSATAKIRQSQEQTSGAIATHKGAIYPARGVMVEEDGTIKLTAYPVARSDLANTDSFQNCQS